MVVLEQNRLVNITKFVGEKCSDCYINSKYITRIFKPIFDNYYIIDIAGSFVTLYNVKTKQQLNEFLDYIYSR